jgi:hypothetical protein
MSGVAVADVPQIWREFLVDAMFAENYELGYLDRLGPPLKNPVVERLLPSLLYVKAVAIFDYALRGWCDEKGLVIPKKPYGTDLKSRIDYLADHGHLADCSPIQSIRGTRNVLAHEPAGAVDWSQLRSDVLALHGALKELGMAGDFPKWEISSERLAAQDPKVPDALFSFDYRIRIADGAKPVADISWSEHVMREGGLIGCGDTEPSTAADRGRMGAFENS